MELVQQLRDAGIAACISGAGPTIIALSTKDQVAQASEIIAKSGFTATPAAVADQGAHSQIAEICETPPD
jgi:homoserine kinase